MSNVVPLIRPSEKATSRNRKEALLVIIPRLRQLIAGGIPSELSGIPLMDAMVGTLSITSARMPGGTYFRICDGNTKLMSGTLDPDPLGKYLGGTVHIMSWKRGGWEARLFASSSARAHPMTP